MTVSLAYAFGDDDADPERMHYVVKLGLSTPNEGKNPAPYVCDVSYAGYFSISRSTAVTPEQLVDVAVVNGASMLYGVIREKVADLTARAWYGELLLPAVNFRDQAPSRNAKRAEQSKTPDAPDEAKPARSKRRKKS